VQFESQFIVLHPGCIGPQKQRSSYPTPIQRGRGYIIDPQLLRRHNRSI